MRLINCQRNMVMVLGIMGLLLLQVGCCTQRSFDNPDEAVATFVDSLRSGNQQELHDILGSAGDEILFSGDKVADQAQARKFLAAYDERHALSRNSDGEVVLSVGSDDWPMPIPLVKEANGNRWMFDTDAGKEEIINRRIGRNELDTIQTCLAIVDAEREYAQTDPEHVGEPVYGQKFFSDPGRRNGLYWEAKEGEPISPLGELVAQAEDAGYSIAKPAAGEPRPFHGYLFRILKSQGPAARDGARDYLVGDRMLGGFAVIAWPVDYGNSGVMTFVVNQDGTIYQQDLGDDTGKLAAQMTSFDPDAKWRPVEAPATNPSSTPEQEE